MSEDVPGPSCLPGEACEGDTNLLCPGEAVEGVDEDWGSLLVPRGPPAPEGGANFLGPEADRDFTSIWWVCGCWRLFDVGEGEV